MRTEGDVGQCDLDLGSSHYIYSRHRSAGIQMLEKHPDQPDMLDAINTLLKVNRVFVFLSTPDSDDRI